MDVCMLMDLGYRGRFWTFEKRVAGGTFTRVRLDRALGSAEWSAQFPLASLSHLTAATSDHCPIFLEINESNTPPGRKDFWYETMWETHEHWQETIMEKCDTFILHHAFISIFVALWALITHYVTILMYFLSYLIRFT